MFLLPAYTEGMKKKVENNSRFWCKKWILLSFLLGFITCGGFWSWLIWADETDIHQQHETIDVALKDSLAACLISGIPGGLISVAGFGFIRWSLANNWWTSKRN